MYLIHLICIQKHLNLHMRVHICVYIHIICAIHCHMHGAGMYESPSPYQKECPLLECLTVSSTSCFNQRCVVLSEKARLGAFLAAGLCHVINANGLDHLG